MLDSKVTELADRMIRVQFDERNEQLKRDIARTQSEMAAHGLGRSGAIVQAVYDLCARDIELRALIVWQNLFRVLSQAGVVPSETLADELKQEVLKYVQVIYAEPYDRFQKVVRAVGIGTAQPLTDARDRALAKVNAEIDLYVLALLRREEAQTNQSPAVFNIYSPVGAIQTGPSATANVVQNFSTRDQEELRRALDLVKQGLAAVEQLPTHPKEDVLDLVEEAQTEVTKPKPNSMRLSSVLTGVASAIQTVGSLQPAYQALKTALLPLGIQLP